MTPAPPSPSLPRAAFDRAGRVVYRWRWLVLVLGLIAGMAGAWGAKDIQKVLYGTIMEVPGTPSQRVGEAMRRDFADPFVELAVVAIERADGTLDDAPTQATVQRMKAALEAIPQVKKVLAPGDMRDVPLMDAGHHRAALLVGLTAPNAQEAERAFPAVRAVVNPIAKDFPPGTRVATTGRGALGHDLATYGAHDTEVAEGRVIPLTMLVLLLAFGSPLAAAMPLAMGFLATAIALAVIALIGAHMPLSNQVQNVCTMIGLALGIDYALLIIGRFREASQREQSPEDAVAETMRTAGLAVACSGLTVMVGLSGLALTPSLDTRSIGLGGSIVILVGVTLALTVLPAALAILGPALQWPRAVTRVLRPDASLALWRRYAAWVMRIPRRLAMIGVAALLLATAPLLWLDVTHYQGSRFIPTKELEFHLGFDILEEMGQKNASSPVDVLVTSSRGPILDADNLEVLLAFSARLHADPRVLSVVSPVDGPQGWPAERYRRLYHHWKAAIALAPARLNAVVSRDRTACTFRVIARNGVPFEGIEQLSRDLAATPMPPGMKVEVGGGAAYFNDLQDALMGAFPAMVAFVVGITLALLALAFRSILVPIKATILNLLSVGAGAGALVVVFQWGYGASWIGVHEPTGGLPLGVLAMIFCVVFGLSMDYEVFLISRIQEVFEETGDNARATEEGLASTGGVITAAALIMIAVFGAFATAKLPVVKMLGVGLGVAVLVDATIVRVLLAPALMRLMGDWNWWPGWRRRVEPAPELTASGR